MTGYSLDSCFLMDLHDRYYPPDIFPGLWERLEALIATSRAFVVDEAARECRSDGLIDG